MAALWTIEELGQQVEAALAAADYEAPLNGQIRAIPNARAIRYYTTLGLVDRPAQMRGRTAYYGRRHLLQLIAVKRLQESGAALSDVQTRLAGLTDRQLAAIARVDTAATISTPPRRAPERGDFWHALPPPPAAPPEPAVAAPAPDRAPPIAAPVQMTHIALAPGVVVVFASDRAAGAADSRALATAAEPLIRELESRGLIRAG